VGGTCSIHVNTINSYKRLVGKAAWTDSHTVADNIKELEIKYCGSFLSGTPGTGD
jgi:hypothetical protein